MNNHNNHNSKMMWGMMGCFLLVIMFIAFSSGTGGFAIGLNWLWFIFVLLFIGLHVGMLFPGQRSDKDGKHH